jgi:TPP-dependent pyruvate/acetoin dehydrogenase alpha subunit
VDSWMKRDPIDTFRKKLMEKGVLTEEDVQRIDGEAAAEMEEAERFSTESPWPDPKDFEKALYAD